MLQVGKLFSAIEKKLGHRTCLVNAKLAELVYTQLGDLLFGEAFNIVDDAKGMFAL